MHKGSQEWVAGLAQSLKGLGPEVEPPILAQAPAGLVGVVSPVLRVSFCVSFYISLSLWLPYLFLARSPLALSAAPGHPPLPEHTTVICIEKEDACFSFSWLCSNYKETQLQH